MIITLINSWQAMGFCMLIYLAGLQNIPKMYQEAALLDGATKQQIFFKVKLPLLMPAVTTAVITNLIGGFKLYDIIVTLTNGGPNRKSLSLSYYISLLYFSDEKAGYSSIVGIALFVIIFLVAVPINHCQEAERWSIDGRSRLQKRKYEGTACADKKVKAGVYVIGFCPSGSGIPCFKLHDVKPIFPLYDRSVAETVSAGKMDTG